MSEHKTYTADADNTVLKQGQETLYYDEGNQVLYKIIDIQFFKYEWIHIGSWRNETDQTDEYEYTFRNTLSITGGEDVDREWNFKKVLKGLSALFDGSASTITEEIDSTTATSKATIRVWPKSSIHLYQKRYSLRPVVWFRLDAWNELWTVGRWEEDGVAFVEASVEINASDYLTTTNALYGSSTVYVTPASNIQAQDNIKRFEDCPRECQRYLLDRGI